MKLFKAILLIFGLLPLSLTSCDNSLDDTNIIQDNYRNFYEIYVGSFYDTNHDGIGDLNGVSAKLDYIKDLGYNGIWLMPIFDSNSYHKYNANSYYDIDSDYGSLQDLENLINECHKRDIILILDLVMNHSSRNHPLFKQGAEAYGKYLDGETLTDEENKLKDYYVFTNESKNGYSIVNGYSKQPFYVESNFDSDMPEFNLANQDVINMFNDVAKYWLDKGIDGFRLDAVIYYFMNSLENNIKYLSNFMEYCKSINEDVYVVGEAWTTTSIIADYYQSGITSFFNFDASNFITRSINLDGAFGEYYLEDIIKSLEMANGYVPAPFLDNHDTSRVGRSNADQTKIFYGLLGMMNGSIFTYYGDEIGINGTRPPDQNVRRYMYWDEGEFAGKCKDPVGTSNPQGYNHPPVSKQLEDPQSILNYYKQINLLRNQNPEIARGEILDTSLFVKGNNVIIIDKRYQENDIRIIINLGSNQYEYELSDLEQLKGQACAKNQTQVEVNDNTLTIPSYGIAIIR